MIEKYPLAKAAEGYARMMSGKAEFRIVLRLTAGGRQRFGHETERISLERRYEAKCVSKSRNDKS